jgi:predicted O-methyltransferase YrrM
MDISRLSYWVSSYIKFWLKAKPTIGHGIHSPFVYGFSSQLLISAKKTNKKLRSIELLRKQLLRDNREITITDLGAGSVSGNKTRKISTIAKVSSSSQKNCQLFFKLVEEFQPKSIIELGTSLGLASASMASANENLIVYTIEGCSEIAKVAQDSFNTLGLKNIQLYNDTFDHALGEILPKLSLPFIAFIDGNHKYEPTVKYFHQLLAYANSQCIMVFDDIYWSKDMYLAWEYIKQHPKTVFCIDLYRVGIVFFNEGVVKQDFAIRF